MLPAAAAVLRYRNIQVKTSSPGEVLVMLFDGLHRFLGEAALAMRAGDRARAGERIGRAHEILTELAASLHAEHAPELCDRLRALYVFTMGQIVEANLHQDPDRIDAAIRILAPIREAFQQATQS